MEHIRYALQIGQLVGLRGCAGEGKSEMLRAIQREHGGTILTARRFLDEMHERDPLAIEEAFASYTLQALREHALVMVDDLHLISNIVAGGCNYYPRQGMLEAAMAVVVAEALASGRKLVVSTDGSLPSAFGVRGYRFFIPDFEADDYAFFCHAFLGEEQAARLDYNKIFRFAPGLNAHQIRGSCLWLKDEKDLTTERFVDYLRSQRMASNVDLSEVRPVRLEALKGVDEVIRALEANIIVPLEDDALAEQLGLKPKRGVLLAGPPGTGKTTVGRALAHRLKSKFFLVDGTFIAGTSQFYSRVHEVFEMAKRNAPAIVFFDDMDAIFEDSDGSSGLYRYLLTMLDGLESESAGRVCVMMTAMDVGGLPPALLRSGRIELWLEMSLPNPDARRAILAERLAGLPETLAAVDYARLVEAAEGFTGADLQRVVEDGKTLYAYDLTRQAAMREPTAYFQQAAEALKVNKCKYAEAEARSRKSRPDRVPPWFHGEMFLHSCDVE